MLKDVELQMLHWSVEFALVENDTNPPFNSLKYFSHLKDFSQESKQKKSQKKFLPLQKRY